MGKWFSCNQRTQRVEEISPSPEAFNHSELIFWTRGMPEWQTGAQAGEFFNQQQKATQLALEQKTAQEAKIIESKTEIIKKVPQESSKTKPKIVEQVTITEITTVKRKVVKKKKLSKAKNPKVKKKTRKSKIKLRKKSKK